MENKILELAEKRTKQSALANNIGKNLLSLKQMTDEEIRFHNLEEGLEKGKSYLSIEVKDGVTFGDVYQFACEHYRKTNENILNEKIDKKGNTLLWSGKSLEKHIKYRRMNEKQYSCFEKGVDLMKSGKFDNYFSV
ncbi:MAG: hypothetical protein KC516_00660 [Nanoarchaeota archaeon]|nr:hypothetical protein [Nanoarchaeota archaeon]